MPETPWALALLHSPPHPFLARLLLDHPGRNQQELWRLYRERHPTSRQALGYHLARLERAGLVTSVLRGRWKAYEATPLLHDLRTLIGPPVVPQVEPSRPETSPPVLAATPRPPFEPAPMP